jgi:hypothetical protein
MNKKIYEDFESRSGRGVQHYVIKFVSDLRQVGSFLRFPPPIKNDRHDITELLLKSGVKHHNPNPNRKEIDSIKPYYGMRMDIEDYQLTVFSSKN